jgi:hypothetical protein
MDLTDILQKTGELLVKKNLTKPEFVFMSNSSLKIEEKFNSETVLYTIEITPDGEFPPGGKITREWSEKIKKQEFKRYAIKYNLFLTNKNQGLPLPTSPAKPLHKKRGFYSLYYDNGTVKFSFKMMNDIIKFIKFAHNLGKEAQQNMELNKKLIEERNKSAITLKERQAKRKAQAEARGKTFDAMMLVANKIDGRIESILNGEFINVTLKNNMKVRLQAEPDGIAISDVELGREFNMDEMLGLVNKLSEVNL